MQKIARFNLVYAMLAIMGVFVLHDLWAGYAMEPELGHVAFEADQRSLLAPSGEPLRQRLYGDDTAREIDCAVRRTVLTAFERATSVLAENRDLLERSARLLLEKETLETADLERLFSSLKPASAKLTSPAVHSGKRGPMATAQEEAS